MGIIDLIFKKKRQFVEGSMASIVKWPGRIVIQNSAHTKSGFNIDYKPFVVFYNETSEYEIGKALIDVLNSNLYKIKDPNFNDKARNFDRFFAAGVKTEKEYMNNAKLITLHYYDKVLHIQPTLNGGNIGKKKGFSPIISKIVIINDEIGPEELGRIITKLWDNCIAWEMSPTTAST